MPSSLLNSVSTFQVYKFIFKMPKTLHFLNLTIYNIFSDLKALERSENQPNKTETSTGNPLMPRAMTFSPDGDPILDPMRRPSFINTRESYSMLIYLELIF